MSKHRILFYAVKDNTTNEDNSMNIYERVSIAYLASHLVNNGHEVFIEERDIEKVKYEEMEGFNPDIICLAMNVDQTALKWVKSKKPKVIVCMGTGENDIVDGAEHLKGWPLVDFNIAGEAEAAWIKLLEAIDSGRGFDDIPGLAFRKGEEVIQNPGICEFDINELPRPYLPFSTPVAHVLTSRGCIGNCSFCGTRKVHPKWKARSIKSVVDELEYLIDNGVKKIQFADKSFESDYQCKRISELCKAIIERKLPILYSANFRPDFHKKATPEVMNLLVRSGLYSAFIGAEAGNQEDLDLYHKGCTVEDTIKTIKLFESYGVHVNIGFIMFNPFTTIEKLKKNISFLEDIGRIDFGKLVRTYIAVKGRGLFSEIVAADLYDSEKNIINYKNKSIYQLYEFVHCFIKGCLNENDAKKRYITAESVRHDFIYYLNTEIRIGRQKYIEVIQDYYKKTEPYVMTIKVILANWFNKLLEINEQGFDRDKSLEMSCVALRSELILDIAKRLETENEKLIKVLQELDNQQVA